MWWKRSPLHIFIFCHYDKNEKQPCWNSGSATQLPACHLCLLAHHLPQKCRLHTHSPTITTNLGYLHLPSSAEILLNLLFAHVQPFSVIFDSSVFSIHPLSLSLLWDSYTRPTHSMSQNLCMTTYSLSVQTCHHLVPTTINSSLESHNTFLN